MRAIKINFFSGISPVELEKINYPKINENSSCDGKWAFIEYQLCEDKSMPIYAMVTDEKLCGTSVATKLKI